MSSATRERLLMMILPATLIALAWFGYARPTKRLEEVTKELATAQATEPKPADFAIVQTKIAASKRELESVQKDHQEWLARWQSLQQERSTDSTSRVANIEVVTQLVDRFGLQLVGDSPSATATPQSLPPALDEAAKRLSKNAGSVKPQFWSLQFRGRYANVMEALAELPNECPLAIPVQLTMDGPGDESGIRDWTLVLWL
ncbi:MAG TPA: hypothetical protein VG713_07825 [Pirellulales bacterium]|nr:hypothetical protein [Pirellulales bacterium]